MFTGNSEVEKQSSTADADDRRITTNPSETNAGNHSENHAHSGSLAALHGVGIHTGREVAVQVKTSALDGIGFSYHDVDLAFHCPAHWERLSGTTRTTALVMRGQSRRKVQIAMIEHFMAAAHVWRLQNIEVAVTLQNQGETETVELPILDGSALEWCNALQAKTRIASEQAVWVIVKDFEHVDGTRKIRLEKTSAAKTEYYFQGSFGSIAQKARFDMNWLSPTDSQQYFLKNIAPARTFGFLHEIEALRARGLALGGTLDNALVIDGDHFVNKGGERISNELASHKLLDAVGDFALAGKPILGRILLQSAGHALHLRTLQLAFEAGCLQPGFLMADGRVLVGCSQT